MGDLGQTRLADFCEQVAAKTPTPGGGSVSAAAAGMGASLGIMAARFSEGEKATEGATKLEGIKGQLIELIDADAEAYDLVLSARGLPKGTDEEKSRRSSAIQNAIMEAAEVPLKGMKISLDALEALKEMSAEVNKNLASDLGVSAYLLEAGMAGCEMNVQINAVWIKDRKQSGRLKRESSAISKKAADTMPT